ncbi:hypothetical protein JNK13_05560 [bacterium]|nr:hypothetical protein [bacterium]
MTLEHKTADRGTAVVAAADNLFSAALKRRKSGATKALIYRMPVVIARHGIGQAIAELEQSPVGKMVRHYLGLWICEQAGSDAQKLKNFRTAAWESDSQLVMSITSAALKFFALQAQQFTQVQTDLQENLESPEQTATIDQLNE